MLALLALLLFTAILAWLLTHIVGRHAVTLGLLEPPNQRSFHSAPVPHGGGLGLVIAFAIGILIALGSGMLASRSGAILLALGGGLAALGLWDDIRPLSARVRIAIQGLTVLITLWLLLPELSPLPWLLILACSCVLILWWINLYNFMDGIDGLAAIECICLSGSAILLLAHTGGAADSRLIFGLLGSASLGFLVINWPPARIFMGDVGSIFLGYTLAAAALGTIVSGHLPLTSWLILGAVFWVDASLTLLRRMLAGETWYQAHRSHAYQRYAANICQRHETRGQTPAIARALAHRAIVLAVLLLNLLWLLPLAWLVIMVPGWSVLWLLLAWLPLVILVMRSGKYG